MIKNEYKYRSLTDIVSEVVDIINKDDTYILVNDTKTKITSKIKYSTLLECLKKDLKNVRPNG